MQYRLWSLEAAGSEESTNPDRITGFRVGEEVRHRADQHTGHFAFDPPWLPGLDLLRGVGNAEFDNCDTCRRMP